MINIIILWIYIRIYALVEESVEISKTFTSNPSKFTEKCTNCEAIIDGDATFCPNCGSNLKNLSKESAELLETHKLNYQEVTKKCTNCEAIIDGDATFCPNCGSNLKNLSEASSESPITPSSPLARFNPHLHDENLDLDESGGTRGHSQQKVHTKFFYSKARYAHELDQIIQRFLASKNLETKIIEADNEIIVQGNKKSNIFNSILVHRFQIMGINWTLKLTPINEFPIKEPQVYAGKRELKPSVFIYVYPWFIEDIWNRCTSASIPN